MSVRSFGMFAGAILLKLLQKTTDLSNHSYHAGSSLLLGLCVALFAETVVPWWEGVWMFGMGMMYIVMEVSLTICVLATTPKQDMEFWLLILHGIFGLGNGIGPFVVLAFELDSFLILGVLTAATTPVYLLSVSPEQGQTEQEQE